MTQNDELTLRIIFIVNGENVPVTIKKTSYLKTARKKALQISHNTGRPETEWEIRDETGQLLNPDVRINQMNKYGCILRIQQNERLFLLLKVAAGGN